MSARSALAQGRALAASLMESTCEITRAGEPVVDPDTGILTPSTTVIYTGQCRLRFPYVRPQQLLADGQQLAKDRGILWLPVDGSADVRADDVATLTVNPLDPGQVGLRLRIEAQFVETHATSRRFPIEVIS